MKKFLNIFFVTLGVIFFIVILIGIYFFVTDPLNLKPILFGSESSTTMTTDGDVQVDKHPLLSDTQEKTLETFGIDPANVPSEITPEQEKCFENAIGKARVTEIKNGDSPSALEFFKAKDCI